MSCGSTEQTEKLGAQAFESGEFRQFFDLFRTKDAIAERARFDRYFVRVFEVNAKHLGNGRGIVSTDHNRRMTGKVLRQIRQVVFFSRKLERRILYDMKFRAPFG